MKILAVSDIHGSDRGVMQIHGWIDDLKPDLLIVCGDITHFGPVTFARDFLEGLSIRTLAVPGNCDPEAITEVFNEFGVNLHKKKISVQDENFIGFGGSDPTPFDTLFEVANQEIFDSLSDIMEPDSILVTHAPPQGILDTAGPSFHVGSEAVRRVVDEFKPKLSLFGHIHEAQGIQQGRTVFVNCGTARRGHGALIDLNTSIMPILLG